MTNNFHIGMVVVCINKPKAEGSPIFKGQILTIKLIDPNPPIKFHGHVGLRFDELNYGHTSKRTGKHVPHWFVSYNFKPVAKTDISTFIEMLKTKEIEELQP
jgi:hypothetical protein